MPDSEPTAPPFLTATWRWLVMLNYVIDPDILAPMVPNGTELDTWQGRHYVSIVGFLFVDTTVLGLPVPFHRRFEEVNLRYYVRRRTPTDDRRAVAFVKEIVPKQAIATVAQWAYNEPYVAYPMRHQIDLADGPSEDAFEAASNLDSTLADQASLRYGWRRAGTWEDVSATVEGPPSALKEGSEEQFIAEHYWGYAAQRDGGTVEYRVEHDPWKIWRCKEARINMCVEGAYGPAFKDTLSRAPASAFVADGSPVTVYKGVRV